MRIYPPPGDAKPAQDDDDESRGKPLRRIMKNPFARARVILRPVISGRKGAEPLSDAENDEDKTE